jgi:uncharacterized phage-associated protein
MKVAQQCEIAAIVPSWQCGVVAKSKHEFLKPAADMIYCCFKPHGKSYIKNRKAYVKPV